MSRPIKFRAWDTEYKMWRYFELSQLVNGTAQDYKLESWSEFAGLRDKNGKEIYEGDVVKFIPNAFHPHVEEFNGVIKWHPGHSRFFMENHYLDSLNEYEVIGNIYENPELLSV